jgi:L-seryl-tRNA(Ser) seleniumtransferase
MSDFRRLPSVDQVLQVEQTAGLISEYGRPLTVEAIRVVLENARQSMKNGEIPPKTDVNSLLTETQQQLVDWIRSDLVPVINATGVILHTNLGRAPLSTDTVAAIAAASAGYATLEYNLATGLRGSRGEDVESLLGLLSGAEAALVVNNNAAALLLCLTALARRKRVIIARSQLVEIGGGFRIPEVMNQSGARLVEVGTTNRVHLQDFEEALDQPAGFVLRAHHSNYKIIGFTEEPDLSDLVQLAHSRDVPVMDDLGSGAFLDSGRFGLAHEPTVQESLAAGADLVCFSGDKLLGGPQAGIILGRSVYISKLRRHPLARAVRADKLCLAGLAATLKHYLKNEVEQKVPIWAMISMPLAEIRKRAENWRETLQCGEIVEGFSTVGGGSLPEETLPTWLLELELKQPLRFLAKLRASHPPVIARILADRVVLDPRTVLEGQDGELMAVMWGILKK